jgi:peroxiredoxin Q/BCP
MLNEQDMAPDFELLDDTGAARQLSEFRGGRVLLYFYPKAMTGG